jgi:hypothetical protein
MGGAGGGGGGVAECLPGGPTEKGRRVDLLFDIDNSRSMADKQEALALVINDVVQALTNPPCIDANGVPLGEQPPDGSCACPAGGTRAYARVTDMHIGVISSSIGGHGSDACPNVENFSCGAFPNTTNNDKGHLLTRNDPCGAGMVDTYAGKGFLAWDALAARAPAGDADASIYAQKFKDLVLGAGQIGCGYESQLESFYRFLIDPEPYDTIAVVNNAAQPMGIDQVLLAQRADFLRPDSLLTVVMLSDENDCSTKEFGQFFFANQLKNGNGTQFHLPRPRAECSVDPNDPCCKSCGQSPGNCPVDPTCVDGNMNIKALTDIEDPVNLRCFEQKRRFGIDFLYPIDRYTTGLTSVMVPNRAGELVPNPIFSDLDPTDSITEIRASEQVILTGIVGVPWQDIARDPADLKKGFMNAGELSQADPNGETRWDVIVGDPTQYITPKDPHMIESIAPRSGANPVTGDAIAPPGSPNGTNPINGHEYTNTQMNDLQYACVFKLSNPRDCSNPQIVACDCVSPMNDSPLCEVNPNTNAPTTQVNAKAYPGLRQLALLKSLGDQGVTASICPAQVTTATAGDYAYLPAVNALIERIQSQLVVVP